MKKKLLKLAMTLVVIAGSNQINAMEPSAPTEIVSAQAKRFYQCPLTSDVSYIAERCIAAGGLMGATIGGIIGSKKGKPFKGASLGGLLGTLTGTFLGGYLAAQRSQPIPPATVEPHGGWSIEVPNADPVVNSGLLAGIFAGAMFTPNKLVSPLFVIGGGYLGALANSLVLNYGAYRGHKNAGHYKKTAKFLHPDSYQD